MLINNSHIIQNGANNTTMQWQQFFLGLLEGDGSIQVNHWKKQSLQFRILIKLKYTPANYAMCVAIRQKLNIMNLHIRHNCIILVEDHKIKLKRILRIIDKYGLLLTHRRRQIAFFKYCIDNNVRYSEYAHIKQLNQCWHGFQNINDYTCDQLLQFSHWPNWLCGFSEAEACFCIRVNNNHSFSIAQNDGREVLGAIKQYFEIPNKIRNTSRLWVIETYAGKTLQKIINFYDLPNLVGLVGQKAIQYDAFKAKMLQKLKKSDF